ncbi:TPA: hypothetical protein ACGO2X_001039, partial [Streptococcus suis]
QFNEYGVEVVPVTLIPQVTRLQVRKDTHEVAIPIQVIPWKADVYAVTVGDKYVYETADDLTAVENAVLTKVQVDAQAGSVEKSLVNPLPTTLGEHSLPVLVRFDDGSQKLVEVVVEVVPANLQIHLRFKDGETVVKEESMTLPAGSSVTDLVARLPQPAQGHYEIASSFDQTQLSNLQTSQTIEIPLELITPALPVKVFDKTAVTGLELVTPPTKTDYRPAETVDLAGLQVKLVDNQGLSRIITPDQFNEYGVEVVPVTLTPQVTRLQVRKDTHEVAIPIQVTPWKVDVYSVTVGDKYVYETDDDLTAVENAVLAKVQVDAQAGSVEKSLVNPLPTTLGEHSLPVLVRFDDGSQKRVSVQVIVQKTAHGDGVTHDLPEGVLPPLETAHGDGVTHDLPVGVLPPLETAHGDGVTHELPIGVLPPLETAHGDGVTHDLPVGVLPPLETAHGDGVTHELPIGVLPALETAHGDGVIHDLPVGVLPPLETAKGDGVTYDLPVGVLPPLETAKGDGITHDLPEGVLPPLETAHGDGVTHDLPVGVLPPLETARGESLSFDRPILTIDELVKRLTSGQSVPQGILVASENSRGENSPKPVAKEMAVSEGAVRQRKLTNEQLPKTGDKHSNLTLLGILFAMCQFIFLNVRSKSYLARFTDRKK